MVRIGIVTDSTCDRGPARAHELGVVMVPLKVAIDARSAGGTLDEVEAGARRVAESTRTLFALDTLEYLVKGTKKAVQEIADAVAEAGREGVVRLGVLHGESPGLAAEPIAAIDATAVAYESVVTDTVGAVIGTYAGPRAVGAAFTTVR